MFDNRRGSPRDKRKQRNRRFYLIIAIIVAFIIVLDIFTPHLLSPLALFVDRPISATGSFFETRCGDLFSLIRSKQSLINENNVLEQEVASDQAVASERDFYQDEVAQLQGLEASSSLSHFVVGMITSKPGFSPYDTFIIDVGYKDGIKSGDTALADATTVIGQVSSTYAHASVITLSSSPGEKTNVLIGDTAIPTVATGLGGGNFSVSLPKSTPVNQGDAVALAATPREMFGTIGSVTAGPSDSFEQGLFRSMVNIGSLRFVFIDTSTIPE